MVAYGIPGDLLTSEIVRCTADIDLSTIGDAHLPPAVPSSWDRRMPDDNPPAVRIWDESSGYRTCATCGTYCEPEHLNGGERGARIAFVCPNHGVHSINAPFEGRRGAST